MRKTQYHFSMGAVSVSLRSDCRPFVEEFLSLYGPYRCNGPGKDPIEVEIRARHRYPWRRGPFAIRSNAGDGFLVERRYEVLPHLEWLINWQIIRRREDYVQLHAATLEIGGQALVLPGDPGSGKSTLTAGLMARGWSYLCDEFALIDRETRRVHPYPRALCIKEPSFPIIDSLGMPLHRKTPYQKAAKGRVAFLNPLDLRADVAGRPSPVRWVIFPKYVAGATPVLAPITRSQGAYGLARQCFNFRIHQESALALLVDVARDADCYRLIAGDIESTCNLIESHLLPQTSRKAG